MYRNVINKTGVVWKRSVGSENERLEEESSTEDKDSDDENVALIAQNT